MALHSTLILLFATILALNYVTGARTMSRAEDLELEKEVARLNKPAIITIQTMIGETYDCVDFYKQPAFDHPQLKNHSYKPPESRAKIPRTLLRKIWKNGKGCPIGSVPIKRTTKDDLIRERLASELYSSRYHRQTPQKPGLHLATLRTVKNWGVENFFRGGSMTTSIHAPPVVGDQHSASRMLLQNGDDTIEAGWMVNPTAFVDNRTRLYVYTHVGGSRCYNTMCHGFVLHDPTLPVSLYFPNVSRKGEQPYAFGVSIQQDPEISNWYLEVSGYNTWTAVIGYWPYAALGALADSATYIDWGGQVLSDTDVPTPPMGAGFPFETGTWETDAFCKDVTVTDRDHKRIKVDRNIAEPFSDLDPIFYRVDDLGIGGKHDVTRWMYYGGPGGFIGT